MSKNILIVIGSERPTGNSARLADAFIEGAREAGHDITRLVCSDIHGCIGCDRCLKPEHRFTCIYDDKMCEVYENFERYDGICLATPIYSFMVSAQLKCFIDRLYACQFAKNRHKDSWLIMAAADLDEDVFDPAINWYRHSQIRMARWTERGILRGYGIQHLHDLDNKPELLEAAREMGRGA